MIDQEITQLIEGLVSRSPPPGPDVTKVPDVPDHIWKSVDAIHEHGVRAFPQLIAHFDDERHCLTEESRQSRKVFYRSVGYVCRQIVNEQVNQYVRVRIGGRPTGAFNSLPIDKESATAW